MNIHQQKYINMNTQYLILLIIGALIIMDQINTISIRMRINIGVMMMAILMITTMGLRFKDCNFTNLDFHSVYALGKQDELNTTFTRINDKLPPIQPVLYTDDKQIHYNITNISTNFTYLDTRQQAQIVGHDVILIKGGRAENRYAFAWATQGMSGVGQAMCFTDEIIFGKQMIIDKGFLTYTLLDYQNITYDFRQCTITRMDPPPSADALAVFTSLFNNKSTNSVKVHTANEVNKIYTYYLNNSLYDDRRPLNDHLEYTWKNFTFNYTVLPTGVDIQPQGLTFLFITQLKDDDQWVCGKAIPADELNPSVYGGIQQFLSLSLFTNTYRMGITKGLLDVQLNYDNWHSRMFTFYVGDLYEVIPQTTKFYARQEVSGECKASSFNPNIVKSGTDTVNATIKYDCQLRVSSNTPIAAFSIDIVFVVKVVAKGEQLVFRVHAWDKTVRFQPVGEFIVANTQLANAMIDHSMNRVKEGDLFGSGWHTYARDTPGIIIEDDYIVIYDAVLV